MKQLRFTTTKPMAFMGIGNPESDHKPLVSPDDKGELVKPELKGTGAYIHDDAESLANYDIPAFIDGDLGQLDLPTEEQDILMLLPSGEYPCKAVLNTLSGDKDKYYITLNRSKFPAKKEEIISTIKDLVTAFVYYDRREDEELNIDQLNKAVSEGVVTVDEMVAEFRQGLENTFKDLK
jgi:hypothetical protein